MINDCLEKDSRQEGIQRTNIVFSVRPAKYSASGMDFRVIIDFVSSGFEAVRKLWNHPVHCNDMSTNAAERTVCQTGQLTM